MPSDKHLLDAMTHRRRLLQSGGVAVGSALAAGVALPTRALAAGHPAGRVSVWLNLLSRSVPDAQEAEAPVALSEAEFATLRAVVGRLIPSDDLGPGGDAAGVYVFIDRGLAGPNAPALPVYQAALAALDASAGGDGFAATAPERQDELLTRFESGELAGAPTDAFALVLEHTRRGMFGDPVYGGNRDFAGWDLIGYPGIKLLWTEAAQQIDAAVKPLHLSVAQFGGRGW